jgi:hypothetical protein
MSDLRRRVLYDHDGDALISHVRQDVEPILDHNRKLRDVDQPNTDGMKHVASIPVVVLEQWLNEEHARGNTGLTMGTKEFDALIRRKLADHDWLFLRTDKPPPAFRR